MKPRSETRKTAVLIEPHYHTPAKTEAMARGWHRGLVVLVALLPQKASSFLHCPLSPRSLSRPDSTSGDKRLVFTAPLALAPYPRS